MKRNQWIMIGICGLLGLLIACQSPATLTVPAAILTPTPADVGRALVLGDISDDPGEVIEGTQPLADYLAAHLDEFGITEGRVMIAPDDATMAEWLKTGQVDLYFDSVYPATLISDASGGEVILRRWRFGVETYNAIIFTHVDSGITSLDDLPGRMVAFDNALSTSGYVLPAITMLNHGLTLAGKPTFDAEVAPNEVGFTFSYDDENTLRWLLTGRVSAGATDDYHYYVAFPEEVREHLVLLAETEAVPRQVVVARPGMDPAFRQALIELLIGAEENEAGLTALQPFQTTQFDLFPEGIEAAQQQMRAMMERVQEIPLP